MGIRRSSLAIGLNILLSQVRPGTYDLFCLSQRDTRAGRVTISFEPT